MYRTAAVAWPPPYLLPPPRLKSRRTPLLCRITLAPTSTGFRTCRRYGGFRFHTERTSCRYPRVCRRVADRRPDPGFLRPVSAPCRPQCPAPKALDRQEDTPCAPTPMPYTVRSQRARQLYVFTTGTSSSRNIALTDSRVSSAPSCRRFPAAFPNDTHCTPTRFSSGARRKVACPDPPPNRSVNPPPPAP